MDPDASWAEVIWSLYDGACYGNCGQSPREKLRNRSRLVVQTQQHLGSSQSSASSADLPDPPLKPIAGTVDLHHGPFSRKQTLAGHPGSGPGLACSWLDPLRWSGLCESRIRICKTCRDGTLISFILAPTGWVEFEHYEIKWSQRPLVGFDLPLEMSCSGYCESGISRIGEQVLLPGIYSRSKMGSYMELWHGPKSSHLACGRLSLWPGRNGPIVGSPQHDRALWGTALPCFLSIFRESAFCQRDVTFI
ncbi:hypothetical protein LIA77_01238 [Sarocladium implicatum]|nr:hypothetical protein LIA77_01238 [Sarocladium implicatum]